MKVQTTAAPTSIRQVSSRYSGNRNPQGRYTLQINRCEAHDGRERLSYTLQNIENERSGTKNQSLAANLFPKYLNRLFPKYLNKRRYLLKGRNLIGAKGALGDKIAAAAAQYAAVIDLDAECYGRENITVRFLADLLKSRMPPNYRGGVIRVKFTTSKNIYELEKALDLVSKSSFWEGLGPIQATYELVSYPPIPNVLDRVRAVIGSGMIADAEMEDAIAAWNHDDEL